MNLKTRRYKSYEVVDLVLDDDFKQLVLAKGDAVWQDSAEIPEQKENMLLASKIIRGLYLPVQAQPVKLKYSVWMKTRTQHHKKRKLVFFRYAAIFLMLMALGTGSLFFIDRTPLITGFATSNPPDFKHSRLILTNGEEIILDDSKPTPIVRTTNKGKSILINDSLRHQQAAEGYNQLIVPYGKRSTVLLADGTRVQLNSGSRLVYPPRFNKNKREVYLEGEAYFDVAHNPDLPFFVRTEVFDVQVLGTRFNVLAYQKENLYNTVLVEGKVKFSLNNHLLEKSVLLQPNQIASLTSNHDGIRVEKVENTENHISWTLGYLEFRNERVESLLKRIASYYNLEITFRDREININNIKGYAGNTIVSGKLDLKEDPERILTGICTIAKLNYTRDENGTYVLY